MWTWLKTFPHRAQKKLHLHPARINLQWRSRSHPWHSSIPESKECSTGSVPFTFHGCSFHQRQHYCSQHGPSNRMGSMGSQRSGLQGFGYNPGKRGTGSDSLLDKIQKAAEVVASAVLPPTEQQGIRLQESHYRAVVAPSAPIEVAVPACAYNLPHRKPKATQRCPGQVGGGWEETDSSNGSSHNSSQDMATNSRASVGSKSAASRESSGDLSERTEALQLGDCGQETALINRLTEGSKVFLTREESQHFLKECSTLNCEVVVELLSSKLQDPSHTIQMRALCAVSCLMTSDLLALEQTFRATQRRLYHLSEGPPGPVANKATKILRQFEALMGGSLHASRQEAAHSSQATSNQSMPSACLKSLQPTNPADSSSSGGPELCHPEPEPSGIDHPQNLPASAAGLDESWRCLTGEQVDKMAKSKAQSVRTAVAPEPISEGSSSEPVSVAANHSSLSLFSGMELVMKGGPLLGRDVSHTEPDKTDKSEAQTAPNCKSLRNSSVVWNENREDEEQEEDEEDAPASSDQSKPQSAFSFLNS
ncbi:AP-4 complex accessory subunit Tepsin isoform X2 [Cyprinodon tularosa]|uniref:AP-4 complex accessory subunit Tepsin isoform X2 n=1 Tax=Cyprinodon tularosa TaxID=77115 RepID=UPI0018E28CFF|nr:AP-4 complex accessory subunit Tepsin isoform X2 [Cyprinodon tularosa]